MRLVKALREAVNSGDTEQVTKLLADSDPADVRHALFARSEEEWSLLTRAAGDGHVDIVNQFLAAKASVNDEVAGITPLLAACMMAPSHTAPDIVGSLLEAKADPNATDRYRETSLMKAASRGLVDLLYLLIKANADVNARDNSEHTALYHAAKGGHIDAVKCLLQSGSDELAQKDALSVAEAKELNEIVKILAPNSGEPEEEPPVALPERYTFVKKVLAELPTGNGRVGFPSDVSTLLSGVGQGHYANALLAAGFGVAQLIGAGDKELHDAGVRFTPQRRIIMNGMVRLAVHGWGKTCFPDLKTITNAVHVACTAVRQLHVMWATTLLGRNRGDPDLENDPDLEGMVTLKTINVTSTVIQEAQMIRRRAANIVKLAERKVWSDPVTPADLLRPCV